MLTLGSLCKRGAWPPPPAAARRHDILDISSPLNDAAAALVDDSFLRCFKTLPDEPWNWNAYLFPLWAAGVVVRNGILFPLRCAEGAAPGGQRLVQAGAAGGAPGVHVQPWAAP